jgi:hypothetical protein
MRPFSTGEGEERRRRGGEGMDHVVEGKRENIFHIHTLPRRLARVCREFVSLRGFGICCRSHVAPWF